VYLPGHDMDGDDLEMHEINEISGD